VTCDLYDFSDIHMNSLCDLLINYGLFKDAIPAKEVYIIVKMINWDNEIMDKETNVIFPNKFWRSKDWKENRDKYSGLQR